ncbi:Acyl-CoA dehydrogenase [Rhodococcus sp. AW25M09]|nr:Acyl-CoA dehydrogenase [Rhodococcus sp. AW25M09]
METENPRHDRGNAERERRSHATWPATADGGEPEEDSQASRGRGRSVFGNGHPIIVGQAYPQAGRPKVPARSYPGHGAGHQLGKVARNKLPTIFR